MGQIEEAVTNLRFCFRAKANKSDKKSFEITRT